MANEEQDKSVAQPKIPLTALVARLMASTDHGDEDGVDWDRWKEEQQERNFTDKTE